MIASRGLFALLLLAGCGASQPAAAPPPSSSSAEFESCQRERAELERRLAEAERRIDELETPPVPDGERPEPVTDDSGAIRIRLTRAEFDAIFQDQKQLTRSARAVPVTRDGRMTGIRLFGIRAGSELARLGFQNGDIVHRVNGFELSSVETTLEAYSAVRNASELRIDLTRRGRPQQLILEIVETPKP